MNGLFSLMFSCLHHNVLYSILDTFTWICMLNNRILNLCFWMVFGHQSVVIGQKCKKCNFFLFNRQNHHVFSSKHFGVHALLCPSFTKLIILFFKLRIVYIIFIPCSLLFQCLCWCLTTFHDVLLPPTVSGIVWNHSRMCVHVRTHDTNNTEDLWRFSVKLSASWVMATSLVWSSYLDE